MQTDENIMIFVGLQLAGLLDSVRNICRSDICGWCVAQLWCGE